jgi:hypothetical protein
MSWYNIAPCAACGKQHPLCWPKLNVPSSLDLLTYNCPETQKQVVYCGMAWVSEDFCGDSIELKEYKPNTTGILDS